MFGLPDRGRGGGDVEAAPGGEDREELANPPRIDGTAGGGDEAEEAVDDVVEVGGTSAEAAEPGKKEGGMAGKAPNDILWGGRGGAAKGLGGCCDIAAAAAAWR